MRSVRIAMALAMFSTACGGGTTDVRDDDDMSARFQAFTVDGVRAQRAQQNTGFLEFLSEPSLRMGLYHLPAGANDGQGAHAQDEVYYVVSGEAKLEIDGIDYDVETGSAFFVRASIDHHFHSITSDLDVLVVFATRQTSAGDPDAFAYSAADMVAARDPSQNVWDPFLVVSTMSLGMYMLPAAVGGDGTLTHTFDEINIVVNGQGRLLVGSDSVDVAPGSLVYVEDGEGHSFLDLSGDLDVLILWER